MVVAVSISGDVDGCGVDDVMDGWVAVSDSQRQTLPEDAKFRADDAWGTFVIPTTV